MQIKDISHLRDHPRLARGRLRPEWLYTTRRYPLYWHHIAKNGGTFFKSLLYALDHDAPAPRSDAHDWDHLLVRPQGVSLDDIRASAHSLIILRNPFQRFLSVYFNKVYHADRPCPAGMSREFFETHDLDQSRNLSVTGHTQNCLKLAEWTAANINGMTRSKPNWHLVAQMHQLAQVYAYDFRVLTLEGLEDQLTHLLGDLIPDLSEKIALVKTRNRSTAPVPKSDVLSGELKDRLKTIYHDDLHVFREVRRYWRGKKRNSE